MKTFDELYRELLDRKLKEEEPLPESYQPKHLDCLLEPEKRGPVYMMTASGVFWTVW